MAFTIIVLLIIFCVILVPCTMIELLVNGTKTELDEMGVNFHRTSQ
jgi:hypothetical protein